MNRRTWLLGDTSWKAWLLADLLLVFAVACPPSPPVTPPGPDAADGAPPSPPPASVDGAPGPADTCAAACARMTAVGCAEGSAPSCLATMHDIDSAANKPQPDGHPVKCATVAQATSKAAMRAAGVECP